MVKLAVVLGVPIALLATVASLGLVVVDVREGGPRGHRVVVPVPLVLAQAAVALSPAIAGDSMRLRNPDAVRAITAARGAVEALISGPDGELVRVEDGDEQVVIRKDDRSFHLRVHGRREQVSVNVPLRLALSALPDDRGRIGGFALAGALGSARFTDLVDVRDGDDHVRVSVW